MKKIIYLILGVLPLFFSACNPNEEIYKQLDSLQPPFSDQFSYTLTNDDYNTITSLALAKAKNAEDSAKAKAIGSNHFFTDSIKIADYLPDFLANKFLALDSASAIKIGYNFSYKYQIPSDMIFSSGDTADAGNPGDYSAILNDTLQNQPKGQKALVGYTGRTISGTDTTYEADYALYVYDGTTWARPSDAFELTNADYEAMPSGVSSHNNFSSSNTPEFYLPIFLKNKYPYAVKGDAFEIVYKYYLGGHVSAYYYDYWQFDGSDWFNIEQKTDQFIHNGKEWVFDPTVHYTMQEEDYQSIVDWVKTQDSISAYAPYDNTEYYFGATTYKHYNEFNMKLSSRKANDPNGYLTGLSDDAATALLWARIPQAIQIFLEWKYPDAVPFLNGVPVYYVITFKTYAPPEYYSIKFLCTDTGTFEYKEGPTLVQ